MNQYSESGIPEEKRPEQFNGTTIVVADLSWQQGVDALSMLLQPDQAAHVARRPERFAVSRAATANTEQNATVATDSIMHVTDVVLAWGAESTGPVRLLTDGLRPDDRPKVTMVFEHLDFFSQLFEAIAVSP